MWEIWAKLIVAKGFKKLPKFNKSPNLVKLITLKFGEGRFDKLREENTNL